jgi:hypothetical protein
MFEIGDRVVCIDDNWEHNYFKAKNLPIKGMIYTIRGFCTNYSILGIFFEELYNPIVYIGRNDEASFDSDSFKKVKNTDISQFQALLKPVKTPELV